MTTETAMIGQAGEPGEAVARGRTTFSYCCECGTYDAHTIVCTCCGFDFRGGTDDESE